MTRASSHPTRLKQNGTKRQIAIPKDARIDPADPMQFLAAISSTPNVVSSRPEAKGSQLHNPSITSLTHTIALYR